MSTKQIIEIAIREGHLLVDPKRFVPGTYGCHEAMHMASFFAGAVDEELCEHQAITQNPEWKKLADDARDKLIALYNVIGTAHCTDDLQKPESQ